MDINDLAKASANVKRLNKELLNCYHMLEDLNLNEKGLLLVAREIRKLRRERRPYRELENLASALGITAKNLKKVKQHPAAAKQRAEAYKSKARAGLERLLKGGK